MNADIYTGLTLTTSSTTGAVLIAFLAIFVSLVGARSWVLLSFAIHKLGARARNHDSLHAQSQDVFRNAVAEVPTFTSLLRLGWASRAKGQSSLRRTFPYASLAIIHFSVFFFASLYSSQVALNQSGSSNALVRSSSCGTFVDSIRHGLSSMTAYAIESLTHETRDALQYVDKCYGTTTDSTDCNTFAEREIGFSITGSVTCPFKPDWRCCFPLSIEKCKNNTAQAIRMDTGRLDTIRLGFNAPLEERIFYRKVTTCSPISFSPDEKIHNEATPGDPTIDFHVGTNIVGFNRTGSSPTYSYHMVGKTLIFDYQLSVAIAVGGEAAASTWQPTAGFARADADVSTIWTSANAIKYASPSDDRIFGAHQKGELWFWQPDEPIGVIGCTDQHQICRDDTEEACTPLSPFYNLMGAVDSLALSPQQEAAGTRLFETMTLSFTLFSGAMSKIPRALGAEALKAGDLVSDGFSAGLSPKQWELETRRWFAAYLATLQQFAVRWANKPSVNPRIRVPEIKDRYKRAQCDQQVVKVTGSFQSFSVLGLAIVLSIGSFIIIVSFILEPLSGALQRFFSKKDKKESGDTPNTGSPDPARSETSKERDV